MRTGLKTHLYKLINEIKSPRKLYPRIGEDTFPKTSFSKFQIKSRLFGIKNELKYRSWRYNFGSLHTSPNAFVADAYSAILRLNPNHLGTWSDSRPNGGTENLEYEVVKKMAALYKAPDKHVSGYITSGGTEGNIYSLWLGRSYLERKYKPSQICLLKTSLTHYSIDKAANICNVSQYVTPLNKSGWNIDHRGLEAKLHELYAKGYRGFILPLTIGYTSTGTQDDIGLVARTVKRTKDKYKNIEIYCWIDASLNGLIEPFINKGFKPFGFSFVHSLVVDFHKFGMVPYSAGIVLYRKSLRKNIEKGIDYLKQKDNTLLGSRQGAAAASIWTAIHFFAESGYRKLISRQLKNKQYFLENLVKICPEALIVDHPNSLTVGVIFKPSGSLTLPTEIEEKYWLYPASTRLLFSPNTGRRETIYKFFFLPHLSTKVISSFLNDLKNVKKK